VRIGHTWDADLVLTLVAPDGTQVLLANQRGTSGDDFGTGAADCGGSFTGFDDQAFVPVWAGAAPFPGNYRPEAPLGVLRGEATAGTWKLRVQDLNESDTGTVHC
jgi:subtilisin-like proprotein convertase family protein